MTGRAEAVTWYEQKIILLCFFAECARICFQRAWEQIERTTRCNAGITEALQTIQKELPIGFVDGNIRGTTDALCGDHLEHGRCANIAETAAAPQTAA